MLSDSLRFCLVVVLIFVKQGQALDGSGDENTDSFSGPFDIDHAIAAIAGSASLMQIPNFHNYSYDDPTNISIIDGGMDMYDTGNKIRLLVNASATTIQYGRTYRDETSVFSSIATHPFVALWWIEKSRSTKYVMEITSNFGSDGTGSSQTFGDEFVSGHAMVDVVGFQLYKAGSSLSVCEVFFVVKNINRQMENSSARLLFHASPTTEEGGVHLGILTGEVFNQVLFGYTLLSKQGERIVTKSEIRTTVQAIIESVLSQAEPTTTDVTTSTVDAAVSQTNDPITSPHPKYSVTERTNRMREVLRSYDLSRDIDEFHRYIYDASSPSRISDGGNDMYDTGNSVYFTVNGIRTLAEYDRTYNGSGYTFSSVPLHPFVAFFVIDKEQSDAEPKNYSIEVVSNLGADGSGSFDSENGIVTSGNYTLSYYTAQVYMAGDPSVCEVYFYIRQNQIPEDPNLKLNFTIPTREREEMKNYLNRTGSKEPGILGYMLLSKQSSKVSTADIRKITKKMLEELSQQTINFFAPIFQMTNKIQQRLRSSNLTKHLPDFFTYVYDDTSFPINLISDGGNDMYDTGNQVYFGIEDGNLELADYNRTYRETDYSFSVLAIHPFIAFFYINTTNETDRNYTIEVSSNLGADGLGSYQNFSGSVSLGDYELSFHGAQVYESQDTTVCEVYFFISQDPSGKTFSFSSPLRDRGMMRNTARLSGIINEAVFGYTLLSTPRPGRQITQDELEATMLATLGAITGQDTMSTASGPITPVMGTQHTASEISEILLNRFRSANLTKRIHDFYRYNYDDNTPPVTGISDGGNDMYDDGNEIYFTSNGRRTFAEYNQTYNTPDHSFSSLAVHPFVAFFYINANGRRRAPYTIEVSSNLGADGEGTIRDLSGSVAIGDFVLSFKGVQVFATFDASVCEVYFYTARRNSSGAVFTFSSPERDMQSLTSVARLDGDVGESVFGYILLSTDDPGRKITNRELKATMLDVLELIVDLPLATTSMITIPTEIVPVTTMPTSSFEVTTGSTQSSNVTAGEKNAADSILTSGISGKTDRFLELLDVTDLTSHITNYHRYNYDSDDNTISDGGRDMYDGGNSVYFTVNGIRTRAEYDRTYTGSAYSFSSLTGNPFAAFFLIDKIQDNAEAMNYSIQVISNLGADGSGIFLKAGDSISVGDLTLTYRMAQVAEAGDASVCEVFFYVRKNSNAILNFTTPTTNRQYMKNFVNLTGNREPAVLGYILLSQKYGRVGTVDIRTPMTRLLEMMTVAARNTSIMAPKTTDQLLQRFRSSDLTRHVRNFHRYRYDDSTPPMNQFNDGGDDMYDDGNMVHFAVNEVQMLAIYNKTYRGHDYSFSTLSIHPFIALFYINSSETTKTNYSIRVTSNLGADGGGSFSNFSGIVSLAGYELCFEGVQVYGASDASVCEVFFHVSLSRSEETFSFSSPERDRRNIESRAVLSGNINQAVFGYMLLSTEEPGPKITQNELEATMLNTLSVIIAQENTTISTMAPGVATQTELHKQRIADVTYILLTRFRASNVTKNLPDFHRYVYDDTYHPINKISDGGNDMYDDGNKVYFTVDGNETYAEYNETYNGPDYSFSTLAIHPFIAFFYINSTEPSNKTFSILVRSNLGADGSGRFQNFSGSVSFGGYQLFFSGAQVYEAGSDASVCEVFFYFVKTQGGETFSFSSPDQGRSYLRSTAQLSGVNDEAILGYTLLSTKSPGRQITDAELDAAMLNIISVILDQEPYLNATNTTSVDSTAFTDDDNAELADTARIFQDRFRSADLGRNIQNFYTYRYDDSDAPNNSISDGGNDMYDGGNKVYFTVDGVKTLANYSQNYTGPGYIFSTLTSHPFLAFFAIMTNPRDEKLFIIEVESNLGADGSGVFQNFSGSLSLNGFFLEFKGVQVYDAGDASVCEVYFHIGLQGENFGVLELESPQRDRRDVYSTAKVHGRIGSGLFGYVLLSTLPEREITQDELEATMLNMLQFVSMQTLGPSSNVTYINETITPVNMTDVAVRGLAEATRMFQDRFRSANFARHIEDFYPYRYDSDGRQISTINDGGSDMYDTGNEVYFYVDGIKTSAIYNQTYSGPGYTFSTLAVHPFIAFFTLATAPGNDGPFFIEVKSNLGADGSGNFRNFSGSQSLDELFLEFKGVQVYDAGDPSVCEVYFHVRPQSYTLSTFELEFPEQNRQFLRNTAKLLGHSGSGILGYVLLSTEPDREITQNELEAVMLNVLQVVSGQELEVNSTMPIPEATQETTVTKPTKPSPEEGIVDTALRAISNQGPSIVSSVSSFNPYVYDGSSSSISDGGGDMYDGGNIVHFSSDGTNFAGPMTYNTTNITENYEIGIFAGHPFTTLVWIKDAGLETRDFRLNVSGYAGADGSGSIEQFNNSISNGSTELQYHVWQLHGSSDPTICEVYFIITDQRWGPTGHHQFEYPKFNPSKDTLKNSIRVTGTLRNMFFGYTLLSSKRGKVSRSQVSTVLIEMMAVITAAVEPLLVRPTQQLDADALFLPSCSAKVAVNSIFRCDAIFRKPAKRYTGPDVCRSVMDQLFRCVAFQMYQCHHGGEENYFDTLVPSCFNSEVMITYLRNLPDARKHDRNNFVDTFCHHAANKLEYPFELPYLTDLCEDGVINELVSEAGKFMYVYLWSKDATEVCPAFQTLRSWFVSTMRNRCSFRLSSRVRARKTRQYLNQLIEVVIAAVDKMESTICTFFTQPEVLVIKEFEELMLGGKQSQPKKEEGGSQKRRRSQRTN